MATKKSKKVEALAASKATVALDTTTLGNVVIETKISKTELAEYIGRTAKDELYAAAQAAEKELYAAARAQLLPDAELTPDQYNALELFRRLFNGNSAAYLWPGDNCNSPKLGIYERDSAGMYDAVSWRLPVSEVQKCHPTVARREEAARKEYEARIRWQQFNPETAKKTVIETLLNASADGQEVLQQIRSMIDKAVRGA